MAQSSTDISQAIAAYRASTQSASVTPNVTGAILSALLDLLNGQTDTLEAVVSAAGANTEALASLQKTLDQVFPQIMAKGVYCDSSGFILTSKLNSAVLLSGEPGLKAKLPADIVYSDTPLSVAQLPWDDATFQSKLADIALTRDWLAAVTTTLAGTEPTRYQDPNATSSLTPLRANGYYPADNPSRPYFAYGLWLSALEARMMLVDRWHPYSGGLQMRSRVNIPVGVKSTDTNLSLAYCVVNNYLPQVVNLGEKGWATSVAPLSLYRAFDNAANLTAIVGEIDMRYLPDAKSAQFMLRSCPNLSKFLLANIPDTVTTLDLTGVADAWTVGFKRAVSADQTVATITESSLMHLCRNITRDITRSKLLQIQVRSAHYAACQTAQNAVIKEFRENALNESANTLETLVEFVDSGSGEITPTLLL